jgi:hypothetical protein
MLSHLDRKLMEKKKMKSRVCYLKNEREDLPKEQMGVVKG